MKQLGAYYTTAQVAEMRATHRVAAFRWLSRNAGKHFRRVGRYGVISKTIYHRLALAEHVDDKFAKVERRLDDLEEHCDLQAKRIDALVQQVRGMRSGASLRSRS